MVGLIRYPAEIQKKMMHNIIKINKNFTKCIYIYV